MDNIQRALGRLYSMGMLKMDFTKRSDETLTGLADQFLPAKRS